MEPGGDPGAMRALCSALGDARVYGGIFAPGGCAGIAHDPASAARRRFPASARLSARGRVGALAAVRRDVIAGHFAVLDPALHLDVAVADVDLEVK